MALSEKNKKTLVKTVRKQVATAFRELLSDPDAGRILNARTEMRLRKSVASVRKNGTRSLDEVLRRHNL